MRKHDGATGGTPGGAINHPVKSGDKSPHSKKGGQQEVMSPPESFSFFFPLSLSQCAVVMPKAFFSELTD
jgi:hypothetical protein